MRMIDWIFLAWTAAMSVVGFGLFAYDKFRARTSRSRISEFQLTLAGALGGWLGGAIAMVLFRHKTSKPSFLVKYAGSLIIWIAGIYLWRILR